MFPAFLRKTEISKISEGSTVIVEGTVRADREMALPGEGTKCVYYELLVEVYKKGARGMGRPLWFPEKLDRKLSGFFVSDGTGEIFVDVPAEQVILQGGFQTGGKLDKKGRRRFSARMIREGDRVRLRGTVASGVAGVPDGMMMLEPDRKGRLKITAGPA